MHAVRHRFFLCFEEAPADLCGGGRLGVCQCDTIYWGLAIRDWVAGFVVVACAAAACPDVWAQNDEFRVYTEHPRLILTAQRLRLLKRERERDSARWRQLDALVKGAAILPEPGFSLGLYYAVSGDAAAGKR